MISRNKELMAQAMKYAQCRLSVPTLDQVAAAALYTVGPDYFAAVREEYKRRRDTVVNKLHEIPGVVCECPRGAFYIMAALPVDDADAFQKWLLEEFEDNGDTVMFAPGEPSTVPRQGQERDPHRLCAEAGGPGARHGPAGQGYRRLQRPVNGYTQKRKPFWAFFFAYLTPSAPYRSVRAGQRR